MAMALEQVRERRRARRPVGIQVTDRDRELFRWINGHGFATVAQVGRWMGTHYQTAQRRVQLLVRHGYLQSAWVLHGEPRAIWPTKLGWRLSGDGLSPVRQMSPGVYRHDRMVVDISQMILAKNPGARFVPARRLRRKLWQDNPEARPPHVSDGVFEMPNGDRVTIELELTAKNRTALEKIILDHAADLEIDQVWYFVMDGSVRRLVERYTKGQDIFSVHDWRDEV